MYQFLKPDLAEIHNNSIDSFKKLEEKTLLITGGTGFFGKWLLLSFLYAIETLGYKIKLLVLSRNPEKFLLDFPQLQNHPNFIFIKGDIKNFTFPQEQIDYLIHAATEASQDMIQHAPQIMLETILEGTKHVLNCAKNCKIKNILLVSSGAVYGTQPQELSHLPEDYFGGPNILSAQSAYSEGKRLAELQAAIHVFLEKDCRISIARCFAFVGPFLPLNKHYAIGNFISNCLNNEDIKINGDGTPLRSYLYPTDLIISLLKILTHGQSLRAYNVGSSNSLSIKETAELVRFTWSKISKDKNLDFTLPTISITKKTILDAPIHKYVPETSRIEVELGLKKGISDSNAIYKTFDFYLKFKNLKVNP